VVAFFRGYPGVVGMAVSGSIARGVADEHSDLDVVVFFADAESRERAWDERWSWDIAPWFHRFDADHVRPYFVIYLFEPGVKTDLPLLLVSDDPEPGGAPYEVVWDRTGDVTRWVEASNSGRSTQGHFGERPVNEAVDREHVMVAVPLDRRAQRNRIRAGIALVPVVDEGDRHRRLVAGLHRLWGAGDNAEVAGGLAEVTGNR